MDKRAAAQYLDKIFGKRTGYVAVAHKDKDGSWEERQFSWPEDKVKIIGWADDQTGNVFVCPALRQDAHTRKKGDALPTRWLWADVDWQNVPKDKQAEVRARVKEVSTFAILSGTSDNTHVYVQLTADVAAGEFLRLNTGLRDYLYADNKQADNSLLRLPGTTNWKTDQGTPVKASGGHGKPISKTALLKHRIFRDVKVIEDAESSEWSFTEVEGLPRRVQSMLAMTVDEAIARYGSRYKAVWGITGELHKRGFDADAIHSLMDKFPAAISKMSDENGYDVHSDVDKRITWDRTKETDSPEADEDAGEVFEEISLEDMRSSVISEGVEKELLRRDIRRAADMAEAAAGHIRPPDDMSESLDDALSVPASLVQWLIQDMCSATATVVITGQFKTGKTKMMIASLISSLVDGEPFLGSKQMHVPEGGAVVGHWNLEMSRLDFVDKYARPVGIKNTHNLKLAHWRGYRVNILTEQGKADAVEWLKSRHCQVWTIDSWTALCRMCGVDGNEGKDVSRILGAIEEIKVEAGVSVCFFLAHTAKSGDPEKPATRGASEVDEHVDTRWMLTVDRSEVRFIQTQGRDTQMNAMSLDFDEDTGRSTIGAVTRQSAASDGLNQVIVRVVKDHHPRGVNQMTLVKLVKETIRKGEASIREGVKEAQENGWIRIESIPNPSGRGRAQQMHYLADDAPPEEDRKRNATPREVNLAGVSLPRSRKSSTN